LKLKIYQVDAFADQPFEGNPAAVCPLDTWLDDETLQAIAGENNLSETAYIVPAKKGYHIRWFTPTTEVELCGHATLASAFILFSELRFKGEKLVFDSLSGELVVTKEGELFTMDFPAMIPKRCDISPVLVETLGSWPLEVLSADDYIAVYEREEDILEINPDLFRMTQLDRRGVIVTAPGKRSDFVSRFFAPKYGINEDPVTGSAHCELAPYWAGRLKKDKLTARQLSARGGELLCELSGERVLLSGSAVKYMEGEVYI